MEFGRFRELGNWCKKRTGSGFMFTRPKQRLWDVTIIT